MSLKEGQYQLDDLVFGKGTMIKVLGSEQVNYQVTPGDMAIPQSDELRFSKDYIQPGVRQFSIAVLNNYILPGQVPPSVAPETLVSGRDLVDNFLKRWRADDIRKEWGLTKPLSYCADGQQRVIYGRPRNVAAEPLRNRPGWYGITASYQMADTLSYSSDTSQVIFSQGGSATAVRGTGSAPTWVRAIILGPVVNPILTLGPHVITVGTEDDPVSVPAGGFIEISSYPWERRAVLRTYFPPDETTSSQSDGFWGNVQYILRTIRSFLDIAEWRTRTAQFIDNFLSAVIPGYNPVFSDVASAINGTYAGSDTILQKISEIVQLLLGLPAVNVDTTPFVPSEDDWVLLNIGADLVGDTPYLADIRFPAMDSWVCSMTGTSGSASVMVQWQEAYHAI